MEQILDIVKKHSIFGLTGNNYLANAIKNLVEAMKNPNNLSNAAMLVQDFKEKSGIKTK